MLQLSSREEGKGQKGKERKRRTKRNNANSPFQTGSGHSTDSWLGCVFRGLLKGVSTEGGAVLVLASGGARQRKVAVGGWQRTIRRLYSQGLHVHRQRCYPPHLPPTHQLPPQQRRFPMVLCLWGSPAVFHIKRLVHFLLPGLAFSSSSQGVSVSVRFQPSRLDFRSHLLERFPGNFSQPKGRRTRTGSRWQLSHLGDLELLWWSYELWDQASVKRNLS